MKTMICLILNRSGSMSGRETDVVNGVNSFIREQKELPDPATITFVRFDSKAIERFRPMQVLRYVEPLRKDEYEPRGGTPLLDAVGNTIIALEDDWRREKPERCIVVIVTDGQENASKEFKKEKIKSLIDARQKSGFWSFIYLGANVDAFAEAAKMGVWQANAASYHSTEAGTATAYSTVSSSVRHMRATGQTVAHNLGGDISEDAGTTAATVPATPTTTTTTSAVDPFNQGTATWVPPTSTVSNSTSDGAWAPPA